MSPLQFFISAFAFWSVVILICYFIVKLKKKAKIRRELKE